MAYRNRIVSVVIAAVACTMLDGCATVKKMVPWGGEDSDSAEAALVERQVDMRAEPVAGNTITSTGNDGDRSPEDAPASSSTRTPVDLSVPRMQRDQPAIADRAKSDSGTTTGSTGDAGANATALAASPDSDVSAGADDWGRAVQAAIHSRWVQPRGPKIPTEFSCEVMVKLTPFGGVDNVQIVRSCGDPALDASIETAVRESSPLPTPKDPADFSESLLLTFTPR